MYDGFGCTHGNAYFTERHAYPHWILIDLKTVELVQSVSVIMPSKDPSFTYFTNVIIRFGLDPNYNNNQIIHSQQIEPTNLYPLDIILNPAMSGQYLSFETNTSDYLAIQEIKIVEK